MTEGDLIMTKDLPVVKFNMESKINQLFNNGRCQVKTLEQFHKLKEEMYDRGYLIEAHKQSSGGGFTPWTVILIDAEEEGLV
jgi:hypothetical protein